ncbi:SpoIIE family protein phosphatase [Yinghuangia seranimata]|uniref:SpoIIE family protein phosphatase n=1 Tax=Yinghuangia seranimata TaxID=408067 RepID=UPI00248B8F2C|nr:SpoIIE family protein phosphatase [Yinghuangia seranimata]MDI2132496.1 SpoIIE family protein phosphatase [Yinghuangia seranimata]
MDPEPDMVVTAKVSATFAPEGRSVAAARSFVRQTLTDWDAVVVVDDAVLLVSELVTNAIVHAGTATEVSCVRYDSAVQIEVVDRYPTRELPAPVGAFDSDDESGRGLFLSASIASAWGVEYTKSVKQVWFRLDLPDGGSTTSLAGPTLPTHVLPGADTPVRVAVVHADVHQRVTHWNVDAADLFGRSAHEAVGMRLSDLVDWPHTPDISDTDLPFAAMLELSRWQGMYDIRHAEGRPVRVFASHVRLRDASDNPSLVLLAVPARARAVLENRAAAAAGRTLIPPPTDSEWDGLEGTTRPGLDELLQRAIERARDLLDGDAAFVLIATDDESEMEVRATTGLGAAQQRHARVPVETSIGRFGTVRMPAVHDDLEAEQDAVPLLTGTGMGSAVTAPLKVEGRLTGTLGVASEDRGHFDNDAAARLQRAADRISLSVESARLSELERVRRGSLSFLAEASDLLAGTLDPEMTLAMVAQIVVPRLATWCAVHTIGEAHDPVLSCVWHTDESRIDELRGLLEQTEAPRAHPTPGARAWPGLRRLGAEAAAQHEDLVTGDVVALPLVARGRGIGMLTLGNGAGQRFRRETLELAEDLSRRAALAMDNARLYSERSATSQALQRSLLPPELPRVPGLDVEVVYQASGESNEVGGDFYDLFAIAPDLWGFAIGDVCGTGPEAAAVTGLARQALRLLAREGMPVPAVLQRLNAAILDEGPRSRFLTLLHGHITVRDDGGMRLNLVSAGHPLPLRLRPDGVVEQVATPQPLLGVLDEVDLVAESVDLDPGDVLLCVTDGVTERREAGRMLGEDGLAAVLAGCAGLTAGAVAARVHRAVETFAAEPARDDMAILVLRVAEA